MKIRRSQGHGCAFAAFVCVLIALVPAVSAAGQVTLFDRTFVRETGQPKTESFEATAAPGTYHLQVDVASVASAVITVNGATIFAPKDFNNNVTHLSRDVKLQPRNRVTVELRGQPGGRLRFMFAADDTTPPTITAAIDPPANAAGWHRGDVRVTFTCNDALGVASCPAPVIVTAEGRGQVVTGQAVDRAGNTATATEWRRPF